VRHHTPSRRPSDSSCRYTSARRRIPSCSTGPESSP
jgi:hypothetical protein